MKKLNGNQIFGIVLIAAGLLFTLDNIFYIDLDFSELIFSLPTLLFLIGLGSYKHNHVNPKAYVLFGLAAIGWGLILYGYSPFDLLMENWPVLIILLGIYILLNDKSSRARHEYVETNEPLGNKLDEFVFWRSYKKRYEGNAFEGGEISIFMGGAELDLKNAELKVAKVVLNVNVIMGGLELWIPSDWNVIYNGVTLFGGTDDTRLKRPAFNIDLNKTLEIKGLVLFGGLEIK